MCLSLGQGKGQIPVFHESVLKIKIKGTQYEGHVKVKLVS